jgi:ketosteroid isomerase-like protein
MTDNVDIARRSYEALNGGNLETALSMMDEEIDWHQAQGLPHGGVYRGLANVRAAIFDPLGESWWDDFAGSPNEFLGGEDHVVVLGRYRARAKRAGAVLDVAVRTRLAVPRRPRRPLPPVRGHPWVGAGARGRSPIDTPLGKQRQSAA